jgi:uncharacterized protein YbdZ (MbtH family)
MTFEARSHGFGHDCLRFVPSSWTTTQNSLPVADQPSGWAFPYPQSSFGEFHTFALPSPRASLGAKQFSLWRRLKTLSENFVGYFVEKSNISQNASTKCADKVGDEDT